MKQNITYAKVSNYGNRPVNEDSIGEFIGSNGKGFIVCDGLGGHGMGDIASSLVRDVFVHQFSTMEKPSKILNLAFLSAQDILLAEQQRLRAVKKMKTTAVSVVLDEKKAYIGHIGDSRLYIFNKNEVLKRTKDHSIPQMLVEAREITEDQIRNHPDRSMLLKVMGIEWENPMYELMKPIALKKCQAFLLCTDGFWELIEESDMTRTLKESTSVEEWLSKMNIIVQENGKGKNMDNNSAIAIWCR